MDTGLLHGLRLLPLLQHLDGERTTGAARTGWPRRRKIGATVPEGKGHDWIHFLGLRSRRGRADAGPREYETLPPAGSDPGTRSRSDGVCGPRGWTVPVGKRNTDAEGCRGVRERGRPAAPPQRPRTMQLDRHRLGCSAPDPKRMGCRGPRRAGAFSPTGHRGTATTAIAAAGKSSWRRLAYLILRCPKRTGQFNPSQICGRLHCRACVLEQCGVRRLKMGVRERRPGVRRRGDGTPLIQVERLVYRCNREFVRRKFCWLRLFHCVFDSSRAVAVLIRIFLLLVLVVERKIPKEPSPSYHVCSWSSTTPPLFLG